MAKKSSDDELLIANAIGTLRVHDVAVPPLTDEVFEYVYDKPLTDSYAGAAETLERANAEIAQSIDQKGSRLSRAYIAIVALVSAISLAFLVATIRAVLPEAAG